MTTGTRKPKERRLTTSQGKYSNGFRKKGRKRRGRVSSETHEGDS